MEKDQIDIIEVWAQYPTKNSKKEILDTQKGRIIQVFMLWSKALVELWKQSWQWIYEHIPYTQLIDVYLGKGFVSRTPIPKWSLWYHGRIVRVVPQSWIVSEAIINGKEIISNAKQQIAGVFQWDFDFNNFNIDTGVVIASMILWTMIYYWMIKRWDFQQIQKSRTENNITA